MNYTEFNAVENSRSRTLEKICLDQNIPEFRKILNGNHYCGIKMCERKVECLYRGYQEDKNGLYVCNYDAIKEHESRTSVEMPIIIFDKDK